MHYFLVFYYFKQKYIFKIDLQIIDHNRSYSEYILLANLRKKIYILLKYLY